MTSKTDQPRLLSSATKATLGRARKAKDLLQIPTCDLQEDRADMEQTKMISQKCLKLPVKIILKNQTLLPIAPKTLLKRCQPKIHLSIDKHIWFRKQKLFDIVLQGESLLSLRISILIDPTPPCQTNARCFMS
jgi:hypothetical protein